MRFATIRNTVLALLAASYAGTASGMAASWRHDPRARLSPRLTSVDVKDGADGALNPAESAAMARVECASGACAHNGTVAVGTEAASGAAPRVAWSVPAVAVVAAGTVLASVL